MAPHLDADYGVFCDSIRYGAIGEVQRLRSSELAQCQVVRVCEFTVGKAMGGATAVDQAGDIYRRGFLRREEASLNQ